MKNLDVIFGINDSYSKYCSITILSILAHLNLNYKLNITIIYEKLKSNSFNNIKKIKSKKINKINFYKINLKKFMRSSIWHKSVFYRFYIDKAFPNNKNKALYIDSDIFVNDSIHKLFNINLKNNVIGAIEDPGIACNRNYLSKIKMQSDLYFNSGVLLINLKKWRSEKITNKLEKTIKKFGPNLVSPDQDLLNIIFEKKFKTINSKWNLQTIMYSNFKYWKYLNGKGIHHFTFIKPWRPYSSHPQTKIYKELAKINGFEIKANYLNLIEFLKMTKNYIKYFLLFNIYKLKNL